MKNILLVCILMIIGTTGSWAQSTLDKPLAVVRLTKTEQIGSRLFAKQMEMVQKQLSTPLDAARKRQLLDTRVDSILLSQAADRDKVVVTDSDVSTAIAQQRASMGQNVTEDAFRKEVVRQTGFTWDEFTDSVRDRMIQEKYLLAKRPQLANAKFPITDAEIMELYDAQAAKFVSPSLVRFNFISIETKSKDATAKQAAKQKMDEFNKMIKSGGQAAFDDIMKKSLDSVSYSGGDSNYIMKGEPQSIAYFGKTFLDTAFGMNANTLSGVLEANYGYYIINITDKRNPKLIGIDDPLYPGQKLTPREQIRQLLVNQKQGEAVTKALDEILKDLRKQAEVSYFEKNFGW